MVDSDLLAESTPAAPASSGQDYDRSRRCASATGARRQQHRRARHITAASFRTRPTTGTELRVVNVDGYVVLVKPEDDGDLHVAIADPDGYTMIIEFPNPACVLAQADSARRQLIQLLGGGPVRGDLKIRVTGVVLFDRYHRESGVASNAVELHPVLSFTALEGAEPAESMSEAAAALGPAQEGNAPESPAEATVRLVPQSRCCKVCTASQPCGDSCISWAHVCHKAAGCACAPE